MVFGCSQKEHDKYLEEVLQRCQEKDLRPGLDKYQLNLSNSYIEGCRTTQKCIRAQVIFGNGYIQRPIHISFRRKKTDIL